MNTIQRSIFGKQKFSGMDKGESWSCLKDVALRKYVWPPVDQSGSTAWPHTCEYMGSTNWTHGVIKKKKRHEVKRKSLGYGLDLGRVGDKYDQSTLCKIS